MIADARIIIVILGFVLLASIGYARIVYLHVFDKDFLQDHGDARTIRMEKISAHRGMITDRMGKPLAVSTPVVSLWANPSELMSVPEKLEFLAMMLEVDFDEFKSKLERNASKNFVYLRRKMSPQKAQLILDLDIKGVYDEREYKRFYPAGEVAAHVVGFTNNSSHIGQEGIELSYDSWLEGQAGKKKVMKNRYGEVIRDVMPLREAQPGHNLQLTIDLRLQYLAYRELKNAINYYQASAGSVVILDVTNGAILSLVNQPSYNPNNRKTLDLKSLRNRTVTDVFEPGSTVKPFTVAVALESGEYTAESTIDTGPGFVKIGTKTIPDPRNFGVLTLGEIIAKSSQVGTTKLALSLNEYDVWNAFSSVGFGKAAGIGFPGEREGYMPNKRRWADIERATFSYGYGFQVTPLQLAAAYQVIASNGVKHSLSLVEGSEMTSETVFSAETSIALKKMLEGVVEGGTGSKAAIAGYSVAGKTGTVRKVAGGEYQDTKHLAFFAGMTPVYKPRLVAVVMIDNPKGDKYGGGAIAAPLFSKIMSEALRLLNVPPDNMDEAA
ncbi:MAG: peptidoglycan D,D-transpeptidase FtsI family protein [Pseudomonadales bacterium]|jgi:cell division protein FtsI (penicillin-binding protein 3)|tara:strand:- start:813 stop:2471 length:1659 start_codon:yes stop_codon:yes gene_type:complete